jgi:hypothetical protein
MSQRTCMDRIVTISLGVAVGAALLVIVVVGTVLWQERGMRR